MIFLRHLIFLTSGSILFRNIFPFSIFSCSACCFRFMAFLCVLCDFPSCHLWQFFIFWCVITFGEPPGSAAARCRSSLILVLSLHLKWTRWQDDLHDKPLQWCSNKQTQTKTRGRGHVNWIPGFISLQMQTHPSNDTPWGEKVQIRLCQQAMIYSNIRRRHPENEFTWHLVNINSRKVRKIQGF